MHMYIYAYVYIYVVVQFCDLNNSLIRNVAVCANNINQQLENLKKNLKEQYSQYDFDHMILDHGKNLNEYKYPGSAHTDLVNAY